MNGFEPGQWLGSKSWWPADCWARPDTCGSWSWSGLEPPTTRTDAGIRGLRLSSRPTSSSPEPWRTSIPRLKTKIGVKKLMFFLHEKNQTNKSFFQLCTLSQLFLKLKSWNDLGLELKKTPDAILKTYLQPQFTLGRNSGFLIGSFKSCDLFQQIR